MSTWEEHLADRFADAGHLAPAIDEEGDHVTLVDAPLSEVMLVIRETLRSGEVVERAARAMYESADTFGAPQTPWGKHTPAFRDDWQAIARVALTAALQGEQ